MKSSDNLPERQAQALEIIRAVQARTERGPSIRQLCKAMGWKSTAQGAQCLASLENKGLIQRAPAASPGKKRALWAAQGSFSMRSRSSVIRERTMAGLEAARARGRKGGRKFSLTPAKLHTAQAAMANRDTSVADLAKELGVSKVTLYRHVMPKGGLTDQGKALLAKH